MGKSTRLDKLIIVDIESTCWENQKARPVNELSEIIEIGVCIFDVQTWKPVDKAQIIVKPIQSKVSAYCTKLTGWTQQELDTKGISFALACSQLATIYKTRLYPWASWGNYDKQMFELECRRKDVKYPFSVNHINLKTIFSMHAAFVKGVGMKTALQSLNLDLLGTHHRGIDDAWNIGRILEKQGRF